MKGQTGARRTARDEAPVFGQQTTATGKSLHRGLVKPFHFVAAADEEICPENQRCR